MSDVVTMKATLPNGAILTKCRDGWEIYLRGQQSVVIDMQPQTDDEPGGLSIMQGGIVDHNLTALQMESVALAMLWILKNNS